MTLADQIIAAGPWNDTGRIMGSADMAELNQLRDELLAGRKAIELLGHLVDPDPCHFDHNGFCQAHYGTRDGRCDNDRAQELLAELVRRADQHTEDCR